MTKFEESANQTFFVHWFKMQYPQYHQLIMSLPNGQNVGPRIGKRLKEMGLLKGAPDLLLAIPKNGHHGLFIEMKSNEGRVTPEQKEVHAKLIDMGYQVSICYSAYEAMDIVKIYLGPR